MLPAEVNIATARNPFAGTRIESSLPVGMTLREMVAVQGLRESAAYDVQVVLNGEIVPDRMLSRIKPKAGTQVIVRVVPHGGDSGKAVLSILISVLVIVAAVYTGGAALGSGGRSMRIVGGTFAASSMVGTRSRCETRACSGSAAGCSPSALGSVLGRRSSTMAACRDLCG